jgi:hypothetical protein
MRSCAKRMARRWICLRSRLRPCYLSDMSGRRPPDRTPEEPPRGKRDADAYIFVVTIAAFVIAVLMLVYALSLK